MDLRGRQSCYLSLVLAFLLSYTTPTSVLAADEEKGESGNTNVLQVILVFFNQIDCATILALLC